MYDYARLRFVTANYENLQGLRAVPLALWLTLMGVFQVAHIQFPWLGAFSLGSFALAVALHPVIGGYYRRLFGRVSVTHPQTVRGGVGLMVIIGLFVAALLADAALHPPIFLEGFALMVLFVAYWWAQRAYRVHYLLVGLAAGAFSLAPLLAPALDAQALGVFNLGFGVLWLALCLVDHLILMRSFAPLAVESQDTHA